MLLTDIVQKVKSMQNYTKSEVLSIKNISEINQILDLLEVSHLFNLLENAHKFYTF